MFQQVHRSAGAEHTDCYEDSDEVRNDAYGSLESAFRAIDKGIVDVDFLGHSLYDEPTDDTQQQDSRNGGRQFGQGIVREHGSAPDDESDKGGEAQDSTEDDGVGKTYFLRHADREESDECCHICGNKDRQEDICRISRAQLGPVGHDSGRDKREARSAEHNEHDHGVGSLGFVGVEFLKFGHSLESHRRGGIIETEHVGRKIHGHRAEHRMIFGNIREDTGEERCDAFAECVNRSGTFADFHDTHPERQNTGKAEREFEARLGIGERSVEYIRKNSHIPEANGLNKADENGQKNKRNPNIIQNHGTKLQKVLEICKKMRTFVRFFMGSTVLYRIWSFVRHRLTAWNTTGEGIHSPYLFYIVRMLLRDENQYYCWSDIERRRALLLRDEREIEVVDYGSAGSPEGTRVRRRVSDIARVQLERPQIGQALFRIVNYMSHETQRPLRILELGTSLGVTTAYLAMADSRNKVVTMEGSKAVLDIAKEQWKALKIENIEWKEGRIEDTLYIYAREKWDVVFIDANHTYEATMRYVEALLPQLEEKGVLAVDDIYYSKEMTRAWEAIKSDARVTTSMDLYDAGLVFVDKHYLKRDYRIRI